MTTENRQTEKWISDLAGVFCDPIIVLPGGWGEDIPDWLRSAITMERLFMNLQAIHGGEMTATDAEACWYLSTASLSGPMDRDWQDIYLYLGKKVYTRWRTPDSGVEFPDDIAVDKLNDYQEKELARFKRWLYEKRVNSRKERDRQERKEAKEAAEMDARTRLGIQSFFDLDKV